MTKSSALYTLVARVSQNFCNILVTWGTIRQLWVFLPRLWRCPITLVDTELAWYSSSATLWICLYGLGHGLGIYSLRSIWPCLIVEDLVTRAKFLWTTWLPHCNQLHHHLLQTKCDVMAQFKLIKNPELDHITRSFKLHMERSNVHNLSAHKLLWYYQPQRVSFTDWTDSITLDTNHKLARKKIYQDFWFIFVCFLLLRI